MFRRMTLDEERQYEASIEAHPQRASLVSRQGFKPLAIAVGGLSLMYVADVILDRRIYLSAFQDFLPLQLAR